MKIKEAVDDVGYIFIEKFQPERSTIDVSRDLGNIFYPSHFRGYENISDITKLYPKDQELSRNNTYSKEFGRGEFPFHTDLAHWLFPPPFLLLRCITGDPAVKTEIISVDEIVKEFTLSKIMKSVFHTRVSCSNDTSTFMTSYIDVNGVYGMRWDSLFLEPVNNHAKELTKLISDIDFKNEKKSSFVLLNKGDTLIIDNQRVLHGRSAVDRASLRQIERSYLYTIKGIL